VCLEITTKSIEFIFAKGRWEEARQEENETRKFINTCVYVFARVANFPTWAEDFLVWPEVNYIQKCHL